jgi:hypothetical protein
MIPEGGILNDLGRKENILTALRMMRLRKGW